MKLKFRIRKIMEGKKNLKRKIVEKVEKDNMEEEMEKIKI